MSGRPAIALLLSAALLAGCGEGTRPRGPSGSTLLSTVTDRNGDARLDRGPGEPLIARDDLGPLPHGDVRELARIGLLSDAHVRDEESPGRAPFLDRLGDPFTSTFRPQEALTAQVLVAMVRALRRERPAGVIELGDLADSAQQDEFDTAITALRGGLVKTASGSQRYQGVQAADDPDPLYYRPGVDAPRHPGLLTAAERPLRSPGLDAPWYPVLGNHDALVDGEVAATPASNAVATGRRLLRTVDPKFARSLPRKTGALGPAALGALLQNGIPGRAIRVAPDPRRRELSPPQAVAKLRAAAHAPGSGERLQYTTDIGSLRVIVLDLIQRQTGSGGVVDAGTLQFLAAALKAAGSRDVVVASHQALLGARNGNAARAMLDADRHVVALLAGHAHRNSIALHRTTGGGYWLIGTASLADFPEQARMLRLVQDGQGHRALQTWVVDQDGSGLASISRELSYLDVQGGRPDDFAGRPRDRNATLALPPRRP